MGKLVCRSMRIHRWLWVASALLLGCTNSVPDSSDYEAVADVQELMLSVLEPAAEAYWDAVGWIIDETGEQEIAPANPEEWEAVRNAAFVIAESGNLLMMDSRALDQTSWIAMSKAMVQVGRTAIEAAETRDKNAVFDAGAEVYYVCTACHATYALDTLRPNDTRSN